MIYELSHTVVWCDDPTIKSTNRYRWKPISDTREIYFLKKITNNLTQETLKYCLLKICFFSSDVKIFLTFLSVLHFFLFQNEFHVFLECVSCQYVLPFCTLLESLCWQSKIFVGLSLPRDSATKDCKMKLKNMKTLKHGLH